MAQFRSLAAFAQFGSDLDKTTQQQLDRGMRLQEILKQPQYQPTPLVDQITLILAGTRGRLDLIPVPLVKQWEEGFLSHFHATARDFEERLDAADYKLTEELEDMLVKAMDDFYAIWSEQHGSL
jgi:F-type H+-transporting ATPase subunit alpha